jgi:hypothetical protein
VTARLGIAALAVVQAFALVAAALSGERWAIAPAAASVIVLASVLWVPRSAFVESHPSQLVDSYRTAAQREEDATVVATPRPARKRVLREEYEQANDAAFGLCAGAATCGACGLLLAAIAWWLRDSGLLILCGGFTVAGFVCLGWWARCRSTVRSWRDQERERGER